MKPPQNEHGPDTELVNQFMLQRGPYITIADALYDIYRSLLYWTRLTESEVAPFDFTFLKTRADGQETFRWVVGYNNTKFRNILTNKRIFSQYSDLVHRSIGKRARHLSSYYKEVLENPDDHDDVEFLAAVFHLTHRFIVPSDVCNVALIHKKHKGRNNDFYRAELLTSSPLDVLNLPPLQIHGEPPRAQVTEQLYKRHDWLGSLQKWVATIQGFSVLSYRYVNHLYFPVYDGAFPDERALRGYLGIFCSDKESRETILNFFNLNRSRYYKSINDAHKKGIHDYVVDNFTVRSEPIDPVGYWAEKVDTLHQWGEVRIEDAADLERSSLFWIEGRDCKVSIRNLLKRKAIRRLVGPELRQKYRKKVLSLNIPVEVITTARPSIESPYIKERMRDIIFLLDDLLRAKFILINEKLHKQNVRLAARRSAIAAVMSRNMSHNLGSHVLASLCTPEALSSETGDNAFEKIAVLHSFLRTRMDFLADVSTSTPTFALSLHFYRDTMAYFKPIYTDEEEVKWQQVLLDFISGKDELKSGNIQIRFLYNGNEISLDSSETDPLFGCPNGLLGTHALYIITENIIRNSAKHTPDQRLRRRLIIVFDVWENKDDDSLLEVVIHDQLGNANELYEIGSRKIPLVQYLNEKIERPILTARGSLRNEDWGVLEMKICAAYLRQISPQRLDDPYEPPLLEAVTVDDNLGYKFYLNRPSVALIVDRESSRHGAYQAPARLRSRGLEIVNLPAFKKRLKLNVPHDFLFLMQSDEELLNLVRENREALPPQIMMADSHHEDFTNVDLQEITDFLEQAPCGCGLTGILQRRVNYANEKAKLFIRAEDDDTAQEWQIDPVVESSIDPADIANLDRSRQYVIFDRHGRVRKEHRTILDDKLASGEVLYYEEVNHRQPTNYVITNVSSNTRLNCVLVHELLQAGLANIVLLDERIQKAAEVKQAGLRLIDILREMRVIVPSKDNFDLENPARIFDKLMIWLDDQLERTDVLVIHLGILERLFRFVSAMEEKLQELRCNFPKLSVIIISGRGVPDTVRQLGVRFIQYSQVARYILEERSKYHLVKVLFAARRPLK